MLLWWAALCLPPSSRGYDVDPHIDTAYSYLNVREVRPNRSPQIDVFNRAVGNRLGSPYCGAFAGYCLLKGGAKHPKVLSGLARHYLTKATIRYTAGDVLSGRMKVHKGDLVIWQRGNGIYGHVGFAYSDWEKDEGLTIEGNTLPMFKEMGKQEGVFVRLRKIEPYNHFRIVGFARVTYD